MSTEQIRGWLAGRLPQEWFEGAPEVIVDREEITVVGRLTPPALAEGASEAEAASAPAGRIKAFREDTRDARIAIARELEHRSGRKVAWGAEIGERRELFTTLSVPGDDPAAPERPVVLDTLVDSGVARSPVGGPRLVREAGRRARGRLAGSAARGDGRRAAGA